uniref:Uncharacterized protein n=1 Tax=Plectus sambesii TaxID=2011161 RepID=A0A914VNU1_9BILA
MNFRQQLLLVTLLTLPCAHSAPPIPVKTKLKHDGSMPHCTKIHTDNGEWSRDKKDHVGPPVFKLKLGLYETACFLLDGSSTALLRTVGLSAIEQEYPVTKLYQFAVPLITSSCKCDCAGGDEDHCNPREYNHGDCKSSQSSLTCPSYHPNRAPTGCPSSETSELCCDTSFAPYKNWHFSAVKVEEPQTFARFTYRSFVWSSGDWQIVEGDEIRMQLDGSKQTSELSKVNGINIEVPGTAHPHKLQSGMYFMRDGEDELRFDVHVNALDGSRPDELGWFRLGKDGEYHVQNENLEMNNVHSVKVLNCIDQKFNSSFNKIRHFVMSGVNGETENFDLGRIVSYSKPWIDRSLLKPETETEARTVVVILRESNSIDVTLSDKNGRNLHFVHNTSILTSFTGTIRLDSMSNRFLVLNFTDTIGTLRGSCYLNESKKANELSFRVYVSSNGLSDASTIVRLPSNINSRRYICLETDNSNQGVNERCEWLDYNSEPLTYDLSKNFWQEHTGDCPGCNKFTEFLSDPLKYLLNLFNPSRLFDDGKLWLLVKVGLFVIIFVVVTMVTKNFILPATRLILCPISTLTRKK